MRVAVLVAEVLGGPSEEVCWVHGARHCIGHLPKDLPFHCSTQASEASRDSEANRHTVRGKQAHSVRQAETVRQTGTQ